MANIKTFIIGLLTLFRLYTPKLITPAVSITPRPTVIQSDHLPNYHLINTFFITQAPEKNWDEPWQDGCEEAAILTVKYYYDHQSPGTSQIKTDLQSMFDYEKSINLPEDINISQMATVSASLFGLKTLVVNNPSLETFKKYLSQNIPVIIPADGKILFQENSHFKSGGPWYHNLVVLGYDDDRQQFIVHDVGTQFGAYFRYSYRLLLNSIHDFPANGQKEDIASGAKNVLVLLK